jgi:hypothetical protein
MLLKLVNRYFESAEIPGGGGAAAPVETAQPAQGAPAELSAADVIAQAGAPPLKELEPAPVEPKKDDLPVEALPTDPGWLQKRLSRASEQRRERDTKIAELESQIASLKTQPARQEMPEPPKPEVAPPTGRYFKNPDTGELVSLVHDEKGNLVLDEYGQPTFETKDPQFASYEEKLAALEARIDTGGKATQAELQAKAQADADAEYYNFVDGATSDLLNNYLPIGTPEAPGLFSAEDHKQWGAFIQWQAAQELGPLARQLAAKGERLPDDVVVAKLSELSKQVSDREGERINRILKSNLAHREKKPVPAGGSPVLKGDDWSQMSDKDKRLRREALAEEAIASLKH